MKVFVSSHAKRHTNLLLFLLFLGIAVIFCADALFSLTWGDQDYWAHLLPILHYRRSILVEHTIPLETSLWYGGQSQLLNPLSSLLYLPATFTWLIFPVEIGTRIVLIGHLVFSLIMGEKLGFYILKSKQGSIAAAILLTSPVIPAFLPVHVERILPWPWLLTGLYTLIRLDLSVAKKGLIAGGCLAIMALTGANYYVLYASILFGLLVISYKSWVLIEFIILGALPGLLHLPSVLHILGKPRAEGFLNLQMLKAEWWEVFTSLAMGVSTSIAWEKVAAIGLPICYLFIRYLWGLLKGNTKPETKSQASALLISIILFFLLATAILYQGHHLLDTFRTPTRAMAFLGTSVVLYVVMCIGPIEKLNTSQQKFHYFALWISVIQVLTVWYAFRPLGTSLTIHTADELVNTLKSQNARSVWIDQHSLPEMFIDAALTTQGIALPNVYYGDMKQQIPVNGVYCGYSFDFLLMHTEGNLNPEEIELHSNMNGAFLGTIHQSQLQSINEFEMAGLKYELYKIICP